LSSGGERQGGGDVDVPRTKAERGWGGKNRDSEGRVEKEPPGANKRIEKYRGA